MEPTTRKWKNKKKLKSKKGEGSEVSVYSLGSQSVLKKKRKARVGRICRKGKFEAWNKRVRGNVILIIIRTNLTSITTVENSII